MPLCSMQTDLGKLANESSVVILTMAMVTQPEILGTDS